MFRSVHQQTRRIGANFARPVNLHIHCSSCRSLGRYLPTQPVTTRPPPNNRTKSVALHQRLQLRPAVVLLHVFTAFDDLLKVDLSPFTAEAMAISTLAFLSARYLRKTSKLRSEVQSSWWGCSLSQRNHLFHVQLAAAVLIKHFHEHSGIVDLEHGGSIFVRAQKYFQLFLVNKTVVIRIQKVQLFLKLLQRVSFAQQLLPPHNMRCRRGWRRDGGSSTCARLNTSKSPSTSNMVFSLLALSWGEVTRD